MYSKIDPILSECFCANNNNIGENIPKSIMRKSSRILQEESSRKNSVYFRIEEDLSIKKEIRKEEVMAIRTRFPNKIPVIVQKYWKENQLPQLDKSKFLVPQDITMSQFQTIIRNRMRMGQNQALYLLVNEKSMLSLSLTLGEIYTEHAGPNGFLHVTYASQEVFGHGLPTHPTDGMTEVENNIQINENEKHSCYSLLQINRISATKCKDLIGMVFS